MVSCFEIHEHTCCVSWFIFPWKLWGSEEEVKEATWRWTLVVARVILGNDAEVANRDVEAVLYRVFIKGAGCCGHTVTYWCCISIMPPCCNAVGVTAKVGFDDSRFPKVIHAKSQK